jgi:uncharacterized protein YfaS (alpha-2-macroglobulin family)
MSRQFVSRALAALLAFCNAGLNCPSGNSMEDVHASNSKPSSLETATTEDAGGEERFSTMVSTDKPFYRAGEKVYVRAVLLNASNHKPLADSRCIATFEIKGPKGEILSTASSVVTDSVAGFFWSVPDGTAGGEYVVQVSYPQSGYTSAERKFDVRAYRAPRLKSQIAFLRDGYGPGEKVSATLDVKRAEGGVPEGAKVEVIARVDGVEVKGEPGKVGSDGLCSVSFVLPSNIPRGEGTLALIIEDGGVVETASKTIPILLQTLDLQMFPEGGDLIAGYPNRVYLQAKQPNGKPADLVAKLICRTTHQTVTQVRTEHEGRGRFVFTPAANRSYYLSISQPVGIKTQYPLPAAKKSGAVIQSDKDIFSKGEPITVHVGSLDKSLRVTLCKHEKQIALCQLDRHTPSKSGALRQAVFSVPPQEDGVLTVTVWSADGTPLAERLVFREPANHINVSITPDRKSYVPGGQTTLKVKTTDTQGKPVPAVVGMTVTDDSVLEMVEKREQPPRLPVMYYLEPEVKDLADAHVYLDSKDKKAPLAVDLLLGTQGWRRFSLMQLAKFLNEYGDQARRSIAFAQPPQQGANFGVQRLAGAIQGPGQGFLGQLQPRLPSPISSNGVHFHYKMYRPSPSSGPSLAAASSAPRPLALQEAQAKPIGAPVDLKSNSPGMRFEFGPGVSPQARQIPNDGGLAMLDILTGQGGVKKDMPDVNRMGNLVRGRSRRHGNFVLIREFAHQVRPDRKPGDREDFSETLFWNAGVKTSSTNGEATISFGLNDSVSTFRVIADAYSEDGALGSETLAIKSVQPFYAEAKLPLEVTTGDQILLPINLINATDSKLADVGVKVSLTGESKLNDMLKGHVQLNSDQRDRWIQPINVGNDTGLKGFSLSAKAGDYADKVNRTLLVKPKGFPIEASFGGILEPGKSVTHTITIPAGVVAGSLISNAAVYPTPLANLTQALERMIQDPNGCFEQTSSTSYPLTMAQQYFISHTGVDPALVEKSREKLDAGYKKLVSFWCPDRGYEWFGEDPGHEALTAFGLLHFADMSKVREVDQNMIATTRGWLLKQKDGQGGFTRKRRSLHSWIEDKDCSNAYIVWALLETGVTPSELKSEIESLKTTAKVSQNSYVVALAANALSIAGQQSEAKLLMDRLAAKQKDDGSVDGIKSSIVGSGGESLQVEGTSLATLAWLRNPSYAGNVERSIRFLADSCKGGRYGSTQSTVLALRAIVTYDKQRAHPKAPGKVCLYVDGHELGDWAEFTQKTEGAIKLPDSSELLTAGEHKLELRMEGGGPMPYSMAVKYNALVPASDKECKVDLRVKLAQSKVVEGAATEANVTVINNSAEAIPTPVAIIGLPGGLEPRHDQLKELVKKGTIDAYEVRGREVVLYWRSLAANAKVEVPIVAIAAVPGTYTGPASRAYLYYTDEHKHWVDGMKIVIAAK